MAYEIFTGTRNAPSKGACVRINREGRFLFNKAATAYFRKHQVKRIVLKYDRSNKMIAFQTALKAVEGSIEIKYRIEAGSCGFNSKSFAQWAGVDLTKSNPYAVEWNQELKALECRLQSGHGQTSQDR